MAFRLSDFWRWSPADSVAYNGLVAAIAAWRPDEVADQVVQARHLAHPPAYFLSDWNHAPHEVATGDPVCEVTFQSSGAANSRMFATGFFWPFGNATPAGVFTQDSELKILTGTPYNHVGFDQEPVYKFGHRDTSFGPHGGVAAWTRYRGGNRVQIKNLSLDNFDVTHDKIGFWTPKVRGQALLVVWAEDNG